MQLKINKAFLGVTLTSLIIAISLSVACWDINFWPTDAEVYYFPAALSVPNVKFISEIHKPFEEKEAAHLLHGKEMYILSSAIMQKALNDYKTLRPFVLASLIAVFLSSILIFLIARFYWGEAIGIVCYLFFTSSFWPYVYVLFAKHQPTGLLFFLLAVYLINQIKLKKLDILFAFLSGASISTAIFSSTVSTLYLPYYLVAVWYVLRKEFNIKHFLLLFFSALLGFVSVFIYFNAPNVIHNIKSYLEYVKVSNDDNHFVYNQPVLQQWINQNIAYARGGLVWIIKYFFLIMPVLFPLYILSVIYFVIRALLTRVDKRNILSVIPGFLLILLSFSTVILAEIKQVAQYGANYFTALIGILIFVCYVLHSFSKKVSANEKGKKKFFYWLMGIIILQVIVNFYVFCTDVYPTRMATTFLSREIKRLGITELFTYAKNPQRDVIVDNLNPDVKAKLNVKNVNNISEGLNGYILIPPISEDSVYLAAHSTYTKFDRDIFIYELVKNNKLREYSICSFKSLVSSRIWPQEEEILAYRHLFLNQFKEDQVEMGKIWLLDGKKLGLNKQVLMPSADTIKIMQNNLRNIGKSDGFFIYKGKIGLNTKESRLRNFITRIYKVGDPKDSLVAYVYRMKQVEGKSHSVWEPDGENNASLPILASQISSDEDGGIAIFEFPQGILQEAGPYFLTIYRTGNPDDNNYYRIRTLFVKRTGD